MVYEQKEPEVATTNPQQTETEPEKKKAATTEADLIPPENKTGKDGGGGKDEKSKDTKPGKEEVTEVEAARRKAVLAKWEEAVGKWLGAPLAKLVLEHVSLDALNGYAQEGIKAAGPALGGVIKGAVKPQTVDQEKAMAAYSTALSGVMTGLVEKWVNSAGGQKVLKGLSNWIQGHPGWTMTIVGTALIGGAVAAWFADVDLSKIEIPLGLPKGWELKLGVDLGTIQNLGFHGAAITVANKTQGFSFEAKGSKKEKETDETNPDGTKVTEVKQEGSATLKVGKKDEPNLTFGVNGSITETSNGLVIHTGGKKLELVDPINNVKITIDESGKWDSKGNKENTFKYVAKAGKDDGLNGSFTLNEKSATVVDASGNIVDIASREIAVAIGKKGLKFDASTKTEQKDGKETTTTKVGASASGQLTKNISYTGNGAVEITDNDVKVSLGGGMTAKIGDKTLEMNADYKQDGPVTGRLKFGGKDDYIEVTGTKTGDVITFKTKDVFPGGSYTKETKADEKKGTLTEKETATANVGKGQEVSVSNGTDGGSVGYKGKDIGGSGVTLGTGLNFGANGQAKGGYFDAAYKSKMIDFEMNLAMEEAKSKFGSKLGVKTPGGFNLNTDIKIDDGTLKTFGTTAGFANQSETFAFELGYRRNFLEKNPGYEDKYSMMFQYAAGRFSTRFKGDTRFQGGSMMGANADLTMGYDIGKNRDWQLMMGASYNGTYNDPTKPNTGAFNMMTGLAHKQSGIGLGFSVNDIGGANTPMLTFVTPITWPFKK
jgi:hypothetical protein